MGRSRRSGAIIRSVEMNMVQSYFAVDATPGVTIGAKCLVTDEDNQQLQCAYE